MWNIKQIIEHNAGKILDEIRRFELFQIYIDERFSRLGSSVISDIFIQNLFYSYKGFNFIVTDQTTNIFEAGEHYEYFDIRTTDIVLDIGSNVGAFSMIASRTAKHVYAVEPLYSDVVIKNITKNNITNITVLDMGLGNGENKIRYGKIKKTVKCQPLSEIIKLCGGHVDFIKIDCEGGEWSIKPEELKGVRRLEGEIHNIDGFHDVNNFRKMLEQIGFKCKIHRFFETLIIIHAVRETEPTITNNST